VAIYPLPSEVVPIEQMLIGAIASGELPANTYTNPLHRIGNYERTLVTRTDLELFAKWKNLRPAFLFDTLMPFQSRETQPQHRQPGAGGYWNGSTEPQLPPVRAKKSESEPESPVRNKGGRPAKYDWDAFMVEIIRIANSIDGLPDRPADLVKMMQEWFHKTIGEEPAESAVKQRVYRIYKGLE
jgi:hypothetical protein